MKILLISDTHHNLNNYEKVLKKVGKLDLILHMGDMEEQEALIVSLASCPVEFVSGNNDFFTREPRDRDLVLGGIPIFMTHGHHYGVSMGLRYLEEEARSRKAAVVLYGHTHRPAIDYIGDIAFVNPGSLSYPRQQNRRPSFGILEIDDRGEAHFTINYL